LTLPRSRRMSRIWLRWAIVVGFCAIETAAAQTPEPKTPKLLSVFPAGIKIGTSHEAEVLGVALGAVRSAWFEDDGLSARLEKVEPLTGAPEKPATQPSGEVVRPTERVVLHVDVAPSARPGPHRLRLLLPGGLTNAIDLRAETEPVISGNEMPEADPEHAPAIQPPTLINGKLEKPGQVHYYSFSAGKGEIFSFDAIHEQGITTQFQIFHPGGSWLSPHRLAPLEFEDHGSFNLIPAHTAYTFRAPEKGRYLFAVRSLFGIGGPGSVYEVLIRSGEAQPGARSGSAKPSQGWSERSFSRTLGTEWLSQLSARAEVSKPAGEKETVRVLHENEPNDTRDQTTVVSLPALVEGAIERPKDVDLIRFQAKRGEKLSFELETPITKPPHFHPELAVIDADGAELITNLEKRSASIGTNGHPLSFLKTVQPKLLYTVPADGDYFVRVREMTFRYGDPTFAYRLMLRRQIPHIGEITVENADHINLAPGGAAKLTLLASEEEGFSGSVVYSVSGLPPGVQALPANADEPKKSPENVENEANLLAHINFSGIMLVAGEDAPATNVPIEIQIKCRPVVNGHAGPELLVQEVPMVVVRKQSGASKE